MNNLFALFGFARILIYIIIFLLFVIPYLLIGIKLLFNPRFLKSEHYNFPERKSFLFGAYLLAIFASSYLLYIIYNTAKFSVFPKLLLGLIPASIFFLYLLKIIVLFNNSWVIKYPKFGQPSTNTEKVVLSFLVAFLFIFLILSGPFHKMEL